MAPKKGKPGNTTARRVGYELIARDHVHGHPVYALMDELIREHHPDLRPARFVLAWNLTWQPDADGRVVIGQVKRSSDLDRELIEFDFVILLRRAFWKDERVTDEQRAAAMDHQLCHCQRATTKGGDPAVDERGRPVWRLRKHDVEEFADVIERHGMHSHDLEQVAAALRRQGAGPFVHCDRCALSPGWIDVLDAGVSRKDRCECWKAWAERRDDLANEQRRASA
jgi:hypothetical protein